MNDLEQKRYDDKKDHGSKIIVPRNPLVGTHLLAIIALFLLLGNAKIAKAQVPVALGPVPKTTFVDSTGAPLSGGILCSYAAGTNTPQATYTDQTGSVVNANPVVLDSAGRANVWFAAAAYKLVLAAGGTCASPVSQQWSVDGFSIGVFANGNNSFTGNETHSGTETFNGTITANAGGTLNGSFTGNPTFSGSIVFNNATFGGTETFTNGLSTDAISGLSSIGGTMLMSGHSGTAAKGENVLIIGGPGDTNYDGGATTLNGGIGSGTGNGGALLLAGGAGTAANGNGGSASVVGGNGFGNGGGASALIVGGNGGGLVASGGSVIIAPGSASGGGANGSVIFSNAADGFAPGTVKFDNPIDPAGTSVKHQRVTTGSIAGTSWAEVIITWGGSHFASTSYTAVCSVEDATTGATVQGLILERILTKSTTQLGAVIQNPTGGALIGTLDCIAMHD